LNKLYTTFLKGIKNSVIEWDVAKFAREMQEDLAKMVEYLKEIPLTLNEMRK
jgi:hypothetical protein